MASWFATPGSRTLQTSRPESFKLRPSCPRQVRVSSTIPTFFVFSDEKFNQTITAFMDGINCNAFHLLDVETAPLLVKRRGMKRRRARVWAGPIFSCIASGPAIGTRCTALTVSSTLDRLASDYVVGRLRSEKCSFMHKTKIIWYAFIRQMALSAMKMRASGLPGGHSAPGSSPSVAGGVYPGDACGGEMISCEKGVRG